MSLESYVAENLQGRNIIRGPTYSKISPYEEMISPLVVTYSEAQGPSLLALRTSGLSVQIILQCFICRHLEESINVV